MDRRFPTFSQALRSAGNVTELCCDAPARLLLPPGSTADSLIARVAQAPEPAAAKVQVLAQTGDGRTLAEATVDLPAGARTGSAALVLPPELRNRLTRLVLADAPSAGSVILLDERWRRRPVGLVTDNPEAANAPFVGSLYYLNRALQPYTEVRQGTIQQLLTRNISVLVLADDPLPDGPARDALAKWVENGGLLIRMAGPRTAAEPIGETDDLLPVRLLGGDRQLGGALSWSRPAGLAAFPPGSPVCRAGGAARRDGLAAGAGGTVGDTRSAHLGGAGGRHAAGNRGSEGEWARRAVPCHRERRLVQPAAVGSVRGYAAPPGGSLRRRPDRAGP